MGGAGHKARTVLIGVPTFRRAENLDRLLGTLIPLIENRPHFRISVVNDGSHDGAYADVVAARAHARVTYRALPENGGCGAARRACFEGAGEDWLVCIDDDSAPSERWIAWLDALIQSGETTDFIAGDVEPVWPSPPSAWELDLAHVDRSSWLQETPFGLMTAVTPNMAMTRAAYERAGGFAADMRSAEDCDITQRLIASGAVYRVRRDLVIGHFAKQSYRDMRSRFRSYGIAAAQYAILRQDWRVASWLSCTVPVFLRQIPVQFGNLLHEARRDGLPRWRCYRRALLTMLMSVHFRMGWWASVRRSRRYTGPLPSAPDIACRFSDPDRLDHG